MTRHILLYFTATILAHVSLGTSAYAFDLGDIIEDVVTAPLAPIEDTIDVIRGDDPATVIQRRIDEHGQNIETVVNAAEEVNDTVYSVQRDLISSTLGEDWASAFDAIKTPERVQFEMTLTSGRYLGGCLRGESCDPNQIVAMPLAAALRDSYKVYWPYSDGIGLAWSEFLARAIPPHVAFSTRISVGSTPDFSVPGMLNSANNAFGHDHAVTIGNIVVFSRDVDFNDCGDLHWLLHEMRHVEQYMRFSQDALESIDGFAVDYIQYYNSMEQDAEDTAFLWMDRLEDVYGFSCS